MLRTEKYDERLADRRTQSTASALEQTERGLNASPTLSQCWSVRARGYIRAIILLQAPDCIRIHSLSFPISSQANPHKPSFAFKSSYCLQKSFSIVIPFLNSNSWPILNFRSTTICLQQRHYAQCLRASPLLAQQPYCQPRNEASQVVPARRTMIHQAPA